MIFSSIYNRLDESDKEDVVVGLVYGLVGGLVGGLVYGLVGGLVGGLVYGLVGGLVIGLVGGIVIGLVVGLVYGLVYGLVTILCNFSEALPFLVGFYPIVLLLIGIFVLAEVLFLLMPKEKLKKNVNLFWHTTKRKAECLFEVILGLSAIAQVYILVRETGKHFNKELLDSTLMLVGYIGLGVLCIAGLCLLFYFWIKLNSVKYR